VVPNSTNDTRSPIKVLAERRKALFSRLEQGAMRGFLAEHTRALDDYFQESFEKSEVGPRMRVDKNPYAVVALGGYGRGEQCVHSDVDLLLLFRGKVPAEAAGLVREIVYPLWDAGLEVGYATRTVAETLKLAADDFEVLTSLVDARFLCGVSFLYTDMMERLQEVLKSRGKAFVQWLAETSEARHRRYGDSAALLEPNLKEGQGGLRDYHFMRWAAAALHGAREPRDLEYLGVLTHGEYAELCLALDFVWLVRNRAHLLCGRKCDQLHFEYQHKVAASLGFSSHGNLEGIELFLKTLHSRMETIKESRQVLLAGILPRRAGKKSGRSRVPGVFVRKSALEFDSPEAIVDNPKLLVKIFAESARLKLPLSVEAARLVREFSHLAGEDFSRDPEVAADMERILTARAPVLGVLEKMLSTGFLPRLIPELAGIQNRIQYTEYHVYPVDKHSVRTVQTIKDFAAGGGRFPLAAQLYKEVSPKKLLLWAALLHDVGKGTTRENHAEAGAAVAERIMLRMGYPRRHAELVGFLVREHLSLVKTATRRDLNDERTAISMARLVGDATRLKMLYLLTVADSVATGPKAWNDWSASLVKDLFFKANQVLSHGTLASKKTVRELAKKREEVLTLAKSGEERKAVEELWDVLSPRYVNDMPAGRIAEHVRMFRGLADRQAVMDFSRGPGKDVRAITVCAKDRPGLFSRIAGVLALHNLNILNARIYTWRNHVALDEFFVTRPADPLFEEEAAARAGADLARALSGDMDLEAALQKNLSARMAKKPGPAPTRREKVVVDNENSGFFTIIEVHAYDQPGLLYRITDTLYRCRLDVWVAKIATKADQVVDVFYVRDFDGQKVEDEKRVEEIKRALEEGVLAINQPACPATPPSRKTGEEGDIP